MQEKFKGGCKNFSFTTGLVLLALGTGIPVALAQQSTQMAAVTPSATAPAHPAAKSEKKPYFVEFRSRSALSYGHTYLIFGKLNAKGDVGDIKPDQVAGLSPITENPWPWMIGHVIPVPSAVGATDGDTDAIYTTARFRVLLTKAEYDKDVAYIKDHQKNSPMWHAVFYNCNAWVGDVAEFMGLKIPKSSLQYPEDYITELGTLNGGKVQTIQQAKKPASAKPVAQKPATQQPTAAAPAAPKPAVQQVSATASAAAKPAAQHASATAPAVPATSPVQ
jgi:hypothetical protein